MMEYWTVNWPDTQPPNQGSDSGLALSYSKRGLGGWTCRDFQTWKRRLGLFGITVTMQWWWKEKKIKGKLCSCAHTSMERNCKHASTWQAATEYRKLFYYLHSYQRNTSAVFMHCTLTVYPVFLKFFWSHAWAQEPLSDVCVPLGPDTFLSWAWATECSFQWVLCRLALKEVAL